MTDKQRERRINKILYVESILDDIKLIMYDLTMNDIDKLRYELILLYLGANESDKWWYENHYHKKL
jgi:hypothetical protein